MDDLDSCCTKNFALSDNRAKWWHPKIDETLKSLQTFPRVSAQVFVLCNPFQDVGEFINDSTPFILYKYPQNFSDGPKSIANEVLYLST